MKFSTKIKGKQTEMNETIYTVIYLLLSIQSGKKNSELADRIYIQL